MASENIALMAHLMRRAGFGASREELEARAARGYEATVEELIRTINASPYTTKQGDDWLKFAAFKLTLDGGMTIGTAYQRYPYGPFGKQLYGKTDPDDRVVSGRHEAPVRARCPGGSACPGRKSARRRRTHGFALPRRTPSSR